MDYKDAANFLANQFAQIYGSRKELALQASEAMTRKYSALEPILAVMRKYNIPFRNPLICGESDKGAVIGETEIKAGKLLHVFDGIDVRYVDAETGEYADSPTDGIRQHDGRSPYHDGRSPYHDGRSPYHDGRSPYHIVFEQYVNTCNFEHVQAGIEYIENLTTAAVDAEKQRNRDIVKLLDYLQF